MIFGQFPKVMANLFALTQNLLTARTPTLEPLQVGAIALKLGLIPP